MSIVWKILPLGWLYIRLQLARCETNAWLWAGDARDPGRRTGVLAPWLSLARGYLFCGGFLDGAQGWKIAKLNAREVNLKYNLLRQMNIAARG
jgi:hypothetical protein